MPRITAITAFVGTAAPEVKGADITLPIMAEDGTWYGLKAGKSVWRSLAKAINDLDGATPLPTCAVARPPKPSIGRIVGFVLPEGHRRAGEVVPAIITRVWENAAKAVQLTPFEDLANDGLVCPEECSSVEHSVEPRPRTWHWLPRA